MFDDLQWAGGPVVGCTYYYCSWKESHLFEVFENKGNLPLILRMTLYSVPPADQNAAENNVLYMIRQKPTLPG